MKLKILLLAAAMTLATNISADTNKPAAQPAPQRQSALYSRMFLVQNPQNLKKVKGLDHQKPVKKLVLDYLEQNAVKLKTPSYARFDDNTQALTVHASLADLDKVETLLAKLREMP